MGPGVRDLGEADLAGDGVGDDETGLLFGDVVLLVLTAVVGGVTAVGERIVSEDTTATEAPSVGEIGLVRGGESGGRSAPLTPTSLTPPSPGCFSDSVCGGSDEVAAFKLEDRVRIEPSYIEVVGGVVVVVNLGAVAIEEFVDRVREGGADRLGIGGFGREGRSCISPSRGPDIGTDAYDIFTFSRYT